MPPSHSREYWHYGIRGSPFTSSVRPARRATATRAGAAHTGAPETLDFAAMRLSLTILGASAIVLYAVLGAALMNDWAIAAASGVPIDIAIAEMESANQPYSAASGIIFASLGGVLALVWSVLSAHPRVALPGWAALSLWSGVLALGAPAFFFASFGNMNSVGDTFYEWNAGAAFALEAPLYLVSGIAVLVTVATLITTAVIAGVRTKASAAAR